jgi:NAD(P)-dependent dehydrogenase (short-subunit alcohol dehydrogenase family)
MELAPHGIRVNSLTPTATDPHEGMDRAVRWGRPRPSDRLVQAFEPFRRGVPTQRPPSPSDYAARLFTRGVRRRAQRRRHGTCASILARSRATGRGSRA